MALAWTFQPRDYDRTPEYLDHRRKGTNGPSGSVDGSPPVLCGWSLTKHQDGGFQGRSELPDIIVLAAPISAVAVVVED